MLYVQETKMAEMDKKTMCRLWVGRRTFYMFKR